MENKNLVEVVFDYMEIEKLGLSQVVPWKVKFVWVKTFMWKKMLITKERSFWLSTNI